ncbi:transcriptional regulator [Bradyrhizobium sp.]|uniref:transcriptional regulator n=1 Tax=Bradyrhizobium sp. TaxID=376 RepID=UPI003C70C144
MGQQLQSWRTGSGQALWLSMLVDTMEKLSRPEWRAVPCDDLDLDLAAVRAQLALPAAACLAYASGLSLRN